MCSKIVILTLINISVNLAQNWGIVGNPLAFYHPCEGNGNVTVIFESGLPPEEENQYILQIRETLVKNSRVELKFDSDATLILRDNSTARVVAIPNKQTFEVRYYKLAQSLHLNVKGTPYGAIPYVQSIVVNNVEICEKPLTGYFDNYIIGVKDTAELNTAIPDGSCGRRKVQHTELIVNGSPTKPGDWPWHAAIYRLDKAKIEYICGGTLLSKIFVLTAAHCVTSKGAPVLPETRNVVLGKYYLAGGDIAAQEREVHEIVVHEEYKAQLLDNDIALVKLKSEAAYDDYVQPGCLWYSGAVKKLGQDSVIGTVAGWGFDQTEALSPTLQQVIIPMQADTTCIKSNPSGFFIKILNDRKFCAGYRNGTSACNGDSGGGFHVFVPDEAGNISPKAAGAWYVRGIVSVTISKPNIPICDPNEYVVFTDVAKFTSWIAKKMG
ncbi:hypothetical protein ACJJTC_007309 [Scirpophaga incertulas]